MRSATCNSRDLCRDFDNNHCEGCIIYKTERKQMAKKFTIKDIKSGYIVKFRNGELMMALRAGHFEKILCGKEGDWILMSRYSSTFKHPILKDRDIMEVYGLIEEGYYEDAGCLDTDHRPLLWKRSEPVKMTVEEINKKLGYEVEIVASK